MLYEYSSYFSLADFSQITGESPWIDFVTTKWFQSNLYWVFLDPCNWNFWGWWGLSEDRKDAVTSDLIFLGLDLKIICWRLILPHVLSKFRSHFSRGLEGPIWPLPHRKRQNSRKIILQVDCSTRYNIILRSEFHDFWHQASTLLLE